MSILKSQRGVSSLAALIVMLVLAAMGGTLTQIAASNSTSHSNYLQTVKAFYTNQAGVEYAHKKNDDGDAVPVNEKSLGNQGTFTISQDALTITVASAVGTANQTALADLPVIADTTITGTQSVLAGSSPLATSGTTNDTGTAARFNGPYGTCISPDGATLYVADSGNHVIRKVIISTGVVSTYAGTMSTSGLTNGAIATARFNNPRACVIDTLGQNMYITDRGNYVIRAINMTTGMVTTAAGTGVAGYATGLPANAQFSTTLGGIAISGSQVYIADAGNCVIRRLFIDANYIDNIAGTVAMCGYQDGITAKFSGMEGLVVAGTNLYVAETAGRIRKITLTAPTTSTVASLMMGSFGITANPAADALYVTSTSGSLTKVSLPLGAKTTVILSLISPSGTAGYLSMDPVNGGKLYIPLVTGHRILQID